MGLRRTGAIREAEVVRKDDKLQSRRVRLRSLPVKCDFCLRRSMTVLLFPLPITRSARARKRVFSSGCFRFAMAVGSREASIQSLLSGLRISSASCSGADVGFFLAAAAVIARYSSSGSGQMLDSGAPVVTAHDKSCGKRDHYANRIVTHACALSSREKLLNRPEHLSKTVNGPSYANGIQQAAGNRNSSGEFSSRKLRDQTTLKAWRLLRRYCV